MGQTLIKKWKKTDIFLMIAIILLPVFMAMQGFDLNDTGYHAQNAAHFLDYATETTTSQVFSRLFDYLFYQVFGFMGLSALYLLNVCTILFSAFFAYKMVVTLVPKTVALLGILLSVLSAMNFIHIANYNTKIVFLAILCAFFLFNGLTKNKLVFFLPGGLIAGFSIFFRFPNVMFLLFIAAILYWNIVKHQKASLFFKQTLMFLLGIALAVGASVVIVWCIDLFSPASVSFFSIQSGSTGSYELLQLLHGYITGILQALANTFPYVLVLACAVSTLFAVKIENAAARRIAYGINICMFLACAFYLAKSFDTQAVVLSFGIITYIGSVYFLQNKNLEPLFALLFIFGTLVAAMPCIGSNTKISHAKLGLFVLAPLAFYIIYYIYKQLKLKNKAQMLMLKGGAVLLLAAFAFNLVVLSGAFMEPSNRLQITSSIQSEKMRGIFTSSFRAEFCNTAIRELSEIPNPYMIIYGADGIHYLTDKIPYLNRCGINFDSYPKEHLQNDLYAQHDKAQLPIVLLPKVDTYSYQRHVITEKSEKQLIIEEFVRTHAYRIQYEDENMTIYVPI